MNKKGQALVEFVIILPIFIFMLLGIIDIGKVVIARTEAESQLAEALSLYHKHKTYDEIISLMNLQEQEMKLEVTSNNKTLTFLIEKDVEVVTPGLGVILGNPCKVEAKRVIVNE